MKRIIETEDAAGYEALLGENVILMCMNYNYAGKLTGVNGDHVELSDASVVYETGEWNAPKWKDAQPVPMNPLRVNKSSIEAYGKAK